MFPNPRRATPALDRRGSVHAWVWVALALILILTSCGGEEETGDVTPADLERGGALFSSEDCARCHGEDGTGGSAPRLDGGAILETFPECDEHLRWVSLGSARWVRDVARTYGAGSKPVRGGMPGFGDRLDPRELRLLVIFTRVVFGGADLE